MDRYDPGPMSTRTFRVAVAGQWVLLVALHLWTTSRIGGPSVVFDEAGYLGNARWLAGGSRWDMPESPAYALGYSLVLAPAMALFDTATAQWRAVLVTNAVLLATVGPLLVAVCRRLLGVSRQRALVAATIGALAPGLIAAGGSAIAENLALPMVLVLVLAAWGATAAPRGRLGLVRYGLGPAAGVLVLVHNRFLLLMAVVGVALVWGALRGLISTRVAVGNGLLLIAGSVAARAANGAVRRARWTVLENPQGDTSAWFDLATTPEGLWELMVTAAGQTWYIAAGSLGLAVVGIVHLGGFAASQRVAWPERSADLRSETPHPTLEQRRRAVVALTLVVAVAVLVTSVVFFAQNHWRPDHWVYGRHNDSFSPLWLAAGTCAVLQAGLRDRLRYLAVAAATVAISGMVVLRYRDPATLVDGFSPFAVPAIDRFVRFGANQTFRTGTVAALGALGLVAAVLVVAERRWGDGSERRISAGSSHRPVLAALAVVTTGWLVYAGMGPIEGTASYERLTAGDWSVPGEIRRLGVTELDVEESNSRGHHLLVYPFHLPEVDVRSYAADDLTRDEPEGPYVIARLDDPARSVSGDRVAMLDAGGWHQLRGAPEGVALWVRPGPEQDRLAAAGLLLPDGFPTELPLQAQTAELAVDPDIDLDDEPLTVEPGGSVVIPVTGRHTGDGSPWPAVNTYPRPGRVRVVAEIVPDDDRLPRGARSGGELPRWVRPGESFTTAAEVFALDETLQPLPAGTYQVTLGVAQEGFWWFTPGGPDATFTLEVR